MGYDHWMSEIEGAEKMFLSLKRENKEHMIIYLDTNVYCRPFDNQEQERITEKVADEYGNGIKICNPMVFPREEV